MINKNFYFLSLISLLMFTACSQNPAPVEIKGTQIFKKNLNSRTPSIIKDEDIIDTSVNDNDISLNENVTKIDNDEIKVSELNTKEITVTEVKNNDYLKNSDLTLSFAEKETIIQSAQTGEKDSDFLLETPLGISKFQWPLKGKIIQRYGKNGNKFNEGINISASGGSNVVAAGDGKVIYIGNNIEGYGNLLIIKHDSNYMTAYSHLKEIIVNKDSSVKKGDNIGYVGQTGNVSIPQLQFTMRKGKKTIDPEKKDS